MLEFQTELDRDVESSMSLFQRALQGKQAKALSPVRLEKILLVLDGSEQDLTSRSLAQALCSRFGASLLVLDAREEEDAFQRAKIVAEELGAQALEAGSGANYERILACVQDQGPDLVIVPSPYARNLEDIGEDSTGTVIDVLMARSPKPLLVVRKPFELSSSGPERVLFLMLGDDIEDEAAGEWAVAMTGEGKQLKLLLLLEQDFYQEMSELMHKVDPSLEVASDVLENKLAETHSQLNASLQKTANERKFRYSLAMATDTLKLAKAGLDAVPNTLILLALDRLDARDLDSVHAVVRHSNLPVLVVPVDNPPQAATPEPEAPAASEQSE